LVECLLASASSLRRVVLDDYGMRPKVKPQRSIALAASCSAMQAPVLKSPPPVVKSFLTMSIVSNHLLSPMKKSRRADSNR
jgi:hypothetical protein